jgi:hypothetical protein
MAIGKRLAVSGGLAAVLSLAGPSSWAQFTSSIEGTVTDPQGAVVPAATVTATNEDTGVSQTVQTSSAGYYRFPSLSASPYTVKVSLAGFKTRVQEHIRLQAAQTRTVNVALELGAADSEEITVMGEAPLVETAEGRVSGLIEETQVKDIPLIGRNFFNLVVLTPGVTGTASGGGNAYAQATGDIFNNEFGVNLHANGARTESNSFLVDSGNVTSSQRNGVANVNPNAEMVQEVRISVNNFSAEYGRNASALVNIITKSGSNDWHGSLAAYYTNEGLQEKNVFQSSIPDFSRKEYSWGFGGPIVKDHTFFFVSGDVLRSSVATAKAASVVTPDFVSFMRANRPDNTSTYIMSNYPSVFTPDRDFQTAGQLLGASCSGGTMISSPVGPIPCNLAVTGVGNYSNTLPRDGFQWTARLDHHFNEGRDRIYASFNRMTLNQVLFGSPFVYPKFDTISPTNSLQFNVNYTKVLSPTTLNEFAFSWVRPYGQADVNDPQVPGISVTGIEGYQTGWGPNTFVQNNFHWRDVLSMTRGSHSLKLGGMYTREHADHESSRVYNRPQYSFSSVFDFAADKPFSQGNLGFDPGSGLALSELNSFLRTQSATAFVQDDWKVKPNLTLNLGLRFEVFSNTYDAKRPGMSVIRFPTQTGDLQTDIANSTVSSQKYLLDGGLWGGGQHAFSPRVSFAWDPKKNGTMSVRAGYGRFYDRMSNQLYDAEFGNPPFAAVTSATIFTAPTLPVFGLGSSPDPPYNYPRPAGITPGLRPNGGLVNGLTNAVGLVDPEIDKMHLDNWFLGVQHTLGKYVVVEANYIGSRGRNAYVRYNVNRFAGDLLDGRFDGVIPGFFNYEYGQAIDRSSYQGGTLSVRVQKSGLHLGAAYTFGRARDTSSGQDVQGTRQDAYASPDIDEGPADFDVKHKLAASFNWQIPGPKEGGAKQILGGWQLAGVLIAQSGTPFTVFCGQPFGPVKDASGAVVGNSGCDFNADGTNNDRPNTPAFGDSKSGLSNDDFLNGIFAASDFPAPGLGQRGNLGRNTFRGPRYFNVDLSLIKTFRVPWFTGSGPSRGADLQIRLETFNLFNTLNLLTPVNNTASPLFGKSVSAYAGRSFQLAGRLAF